MVIYLGNWELFLLAGCFIAFLIAVGIGMLYEQLQGLKKQQESVVTHLESIAKSNQEIADYDPDYDEADFWKHGSDDDEIEE